jgi:branched-chain amino acid transport system substrate-binding protein
LFARTAGAALMTAALSTASPVAAQQTREYKVGVLAGLSGLGAQIGQWMLAGAKAAADQLGKSGGAKFTIIAEDSQWNPQKGVEGYNKLVNVDKVDFMLSGGSSAMEAIAPLATQNKLVVMNTGAQSSNMAGISPYVFSVLQLSDFDTGVLSRYALETLGYKKIATLYVNNDTGTFNQAAFTKSFEAAGGKIVAAESFKPNETSYGVQLAKIRAAQPDAIYIVGTPAELPFAVRQTRQMAPNLPVLSYAGIESKEFLDAAGAAANGIIYTTTAFNPASDKQNVKDFVAAYTATNGQAPTSPYAGYGYDAVMIAAAALEKAGGRPGEPMAKAILDIKNFPGVTGDNQFRDNGTVAKAVAIRKIEDGKFETVTIVQP